MIRALCGFVSGFDESDMFLDLRIQAIPVIRISGKRTLTRGVWALGFDHCGRWREEIASRLA